MILEDLRSTNGTFVNGRPITRHVLQHGDEVLVGKHSLVFDQNAASAQPVAGAPLQGLGDTVYLDTKQHRALRATLESARADAAKSVNARPAVRSQRHRAASASFASSPDAPNRTNTISGRTRRSSGAPIPRSSGCAAGSSRRSPSRLPAAATATLQRRSAARRSSTKSASKDVASCRTATC